MESLAGSPELIARTSRITVASLAAERETIVYCASGYRSAIAASLMLQAKLPAVVDLVGGLSAGNAARRPV